MAKLPLSYLSSDLLWLNQCAKVHTKFAFTCMVELQLYNHMQYNTLAVSLESTAAPTFRGFLIQARLVADDSTVVGQFEEPAPGLQYRYGSCANTEVEKDGKKL